MLYLPQESPFFRNAKSKKNLKKFLLIMFVEIMQKCCFGQQLIDTDKFARTFSYKFEKIIHCHTKSPKLSLQCHHWTEAH